METRIPPDSLKQYIEIYNEAIKEYSEFRRKDPILKLVYAFSPFLDLKFSKNVERALKGNNAMYLSAQDIYKIITAVSKLLRESIEERERRRELRLLKVGDRSAKI